MSSAPRMGAKILIVEDEPSLAAALKQYLAGEGHEVHCAEEREEAETLLSHHAYSLVITDLALSPIGLSGVEVIDSIADQATRPKVIVFSGHVIPELKAQLGTRGVDAILQKPLPLKEVARVAAGLLEGGA